MSRASSSSVNKHVFRFGAFLQFMSLPAEIRWLVKHLVIITTPSVLSGVQVLISMPSIICLIFDLVGYTMQDNRLISQNENSQFFVVIPSHTQIHEGKAIQAFDIII